MSDYVAAPSTGKLKLKGVKGGCVDKKKKSNKTSALEVLAGTGHDGNQDNHEQRVEDGQSQITDTTQSNTVKKTAEAPEPEEGDIRTHLKTEAEKRHEEQRRKRLEERLRKKGVKSHKQRVEELNKYLSNLSEHHDMPKIGPG